MTGARGLKAETRVVLKVRGKRPPKPKRGETSLAERIFVGYDSTDTTHSAYLVGHAFIDDTWAYNGVPAGGLPRCTSVTGNSKQPGCVRYSYDPRSGAVKIGALGGGKLTERGLEIEGETYEELSIPKPGSTYQVAQHYMGFSGLCGLIAGCTTWRSDMTMTRSGEFALVTSSTSTSGGFGIPFVAVGSYPPDQRGTYRVERRARIRLAFADGKVETKTFAIFRGASGNPDPAGEGFVLDEEYFTFAD